MTANLAIIALLFFVTAVIYTSVGFGGGSTYLAVLVAANLNYQSIPTIALICNIIAVSNACVIFYQHGFLSLRHIVPFLILSIPMAFVGGRIPIDKSTFLILVAMSLSFAAWRMLFMTENSQNHIPELSFKKSMLVGLPVGAALGLLAGLTGLGGGIFLAPVMHLLRWSNAKVIAASTSVFILVNSISGLYGQLLKNSFAVDWQMIIPLALAVFIGGQIGARVSTQHLRSSTLLRLTASLMLFVSARIFWETFF